MLHKCLCELQVQQMHSCLFCSGIKRCLTSIFCEKLCKHYWSERTGKQSEKKIEVIIIITFVYAMCSLLTTTRYLFIICHLVLCCWFSSHFVTFVFFLLVFLCTAALSLLFILTLYVSFPHLSVHVWVWMWINYATYFFFKGAKNLRAKITTKKKKIIYFDV